MEQMEQKVFSNTNVRKNVVFKALSETLLDNYLSFNEIKAICKVLGKGRSQDLLPMVVTQIKNLSYREAIAVRREVEVK